MKKIVFIICFLTSFSLLAQDDETKEYNEILEIPQPSFWDNVRFGGGLGLSFGSDITTINVSPSAIYDFQNGFALGVGVGYLYSKNRDFRSNVISPSLITLYNPAEEIQLSAELEQLFVTQKFGPTTFKNNFPALYLGVAYRTGWAAFGVRYDVLYDELDNIFGSPFSPIIRFYF